tara:strand:+ start:466469 stop:467173 length:705 start_codon:yes stop_codon:yes gene_type:complete
MMLNRQRCDELSRNWHQVVTEVAEYCQQFGRGDDDVRVIGVTKYVDVHTTQALIQAGCRDVGESRPQLLWDKADQIGDATSLTWHLIGHLQRNKVRRVLRFPVWIHSIDSPRILDAVADEAVGQQKSIPVLLEANISGDSSKTGMTPDELRQLVDQLPGNGVQIKGLMAMAGLGSDAKTAREQFAQTRELRDELSQRCGLELPELSMGMSGDFPDAIAEGATMVRIGTRLFKST